MSIKIGILTFHASYNCGSMLQAYALQAFLKKHDYVVEIIDFSSKYNHNTKKITIKKEKTR